MSYWPGLKGYGFDPVGTLPDIVNNALIHAWGGTVDLLPAVPDAWPVGSIQGIRARGQRHIEKLDWSIPTGKVELTLNSGVSQTLMIRLPGKWNIMEATVAGNAQVTKSPRSGNCCELSVNGDKGITLKLHFTESHRYRQQERQPATEYSAPSQR